MSVARAQAVSVSEDDCASVTAHEISKLYDAIGRSNYWLANRSGNIHASMKCAFAVEWVGAFAERALLLALPPAQRFGAEVRAKPVRRVSTLWVRNTERDSSRGRPGESRNFEGVKAESRDEFTSASPAPMYRPTDCRSDSVRSSSRTESKLHWPAIPGMRFQNIAFFRNFSKLRVPVRDLVFLGT